MPIVIVARYHFTVVCSRCRICQSELCGRRVREADEGLAVAKRKFLAAGWRHHVSLHQRSSDLVEHLERRGGGSWFCPNCAPRRGT